MTKLSEILTEAPERITMKLTRIGGDKSHRGKVHMAIDTITEAMLDDMIEIINENWKQEWTTIVEDSEYIDAEEGSSTSWFIYTNELEDFKSDYKYAKIKILAKHKR